MADEALKCLAFAIKQNLHGQHLVISATVKHLRGHVETHPKRPLVLSFHGLSGTGKNFVSSLIHIIKQHIVATVQACPESLFIFDEMDKMPSGIMDVVKPFLEYNQPVEGTDYRSSIFLFLR
ncbi:prosalusin-like [Mya arenaria]|uniref:prosalusin-like n=1 Tax=Mya arenaria TaxID=6604 RepID=UPI0022E6B6A2|nr:prosalusin-like [Mya arenaria]